MGVTFETAATPIEGVRVATRDARGDARGSFRRFFCRDELRECFGEREVVQINFSQTTAVGTVRGMHYQQAPHAEMKLVRCLRGRVWDVAVDLRRDSPTFLAWHAEELSPENGRMLIIPEGCAHGFQALGPDSELLYLHTAPYVAAVEGGVSPLDPRLAIRWPLAVQNLSPRDQNHPPIVLNYQGITR
jgi:dTDP-4-dehydrorhamnose 3,5-epimerase